jgi:hypothetical protein
MPTLSPFSSVLFHITHINGMKLTHSKFLLEAKLSQNRYRSCIPLCLLYIFSMLKTQIATAADTPINPLIWWMLAYLFLDIRYGVFSFTFFQLHASQGSLKSNIQWHATSDPVFASPYLRQKVIICFWVWNLCIESGLEIGIDSVYFITERLLYMCWSFSLALHLSNSEKQFLPLHKVQ